MQEPKFKINDQVVITLKSTEGYGNCYIIIQYHYDSVKERNYYRLSGQELLFHESYLEFKEVWNSPLANAMRENE